MTKETSGFRGTGRAIWVGIDKFSDYLGFLAGLSYIFLAIIVSGAILLRYFLGITIASLTELSEYALYVSVLISCPYVLKVDGHVNVDVFINAANSRTKKRLALVCNILGILTSATYMYYGTISAYETFVRKIPVIKTMAFPKWVLLVVIPIVSALFLYYFVIRISNSFNESTTLEAKDM
jgi:TRAP-type C4-dicarboxylate transport system permease small subunit